MYTFYLDFEPLCLTLLELTSASKELKLPCGSSCALSRTCGVVNMVDFALVAKKEHILDIRIIIVSFF